MVKKIRPARTFGGDARANQTNNSALCPFITQRLYIYEDNSICCFAYNVYGTFLLVPIICTLEMVLLG